MEVGAWRRHALTRKTMNNHNGFEPEITGFYCIYCAYMAADTAGALHVPYPANVKFVRMPCTGKTDVHYILEAFEQGADGVYIVACPIGNCHHVRGNERGQAVYSGHSIFCKKLGWKTSGWACFSCPAARRRPLPPPRKR